MNKPRIVIRHIVFTGVNIPPAKLEFDEGCNLIWGASNTGKSFALKAIDFMLGGSKALPDIDECKEYEKVWLGFSIIGVGDFTVSRAIKGGNFALYKELIDAQPNTLSKILLKASHNHKKQDNLSNFLLNHLKLADNFIAQTIYGEKRSLGFRDLAHLMLVDETTIQADKHSVIELGQHNNKTAEHSVFRLLLTGSDDSAIEQVQSPKETKEFKGIKLNLLDEMITDIDSKFALDFPDIDDLEDQHKRLKNNLDNLQAEFEKANLSIGVLVQEKRLLASDLSKIGMRLDEIEVHLGRFAKLENVYNSDMERLAALEESTFLVSLKKGRACPLCGAAPNAQTHIQVIDDSEMISRSALAEIDKIRMLRADLRVTVCDLKKEKEVIEPQLPMLKEKLTEVQHKINLALPILQKHRQALDEMLAVRDRVRDGLALKTQKTNLIDKREETKQTKTASKKEKLNLDLSGTIAHDFCVVVSQVLEAWKFPGQNHVSFDHKSWDLRINGKLRIHNGKGVRAITHAAFKVALLIFCHDRGLPHPGFLVIDTPLLTYRDPIKNPKYGALTEDEELIAQSPLKQYFFQHLYSIRDKGQFIIFENVDPPNNIEALAKVETFTGTSGGRAGFFPGKHISL